MRPRIGLVPAWLRFICVSVQKTVLKMAVPTAIITLICSTSAIMSDCPLISHVASALPNKVEKAALGKRARHRRAL
jgi:hypothetical protein